MFCYKFGGSGVLYDKEAGKRIHFPFLYTHFFYAFSILNWYA